MIETPRLVLRRARADDLDGLHALLSDPQVMRYWATPPHETIDETRDWLDAMIASEADPTRDDFVVEHDGRVIGKAGCWKLPEVGFALHRDCWGKGLGREALEAVVEYLFSAHAIDAITADVDPRNAASLALLARCGFVETGRAARTMEIGDEWCDSVYLALRKDTNLDRARV